MAEVQGRGLRRRDRRTDPRLLIGASLLEAMRGLARDAAPNEACGLLIGRRDPVSIVTRLLPAANVHPEPSAFFTIDPAAHLRLLRELRESPSETLLGHFHSHPTGPAAPSARDLAAANDPELMWMIIDAASGAIAAFLPRADEAGEVIAFDEMTIIAKSS